MQKVYFQLLSSTLVLLGALVLFTSAAQAEPDESLFVQNWKLLLTEKSCEAVEHHQGLSRTALACEEKNLSLNCSDQTETAIVVCEALFGRDNLHECSPARTVDTSCMSLDAINVVTEACQWKTNCQIKASKHEFADPCPQQSKFLRVRYICLNKLLAASLIMTTTTTTAEPIQIVTGTTAKPIFCPRKEDRGIFWPDTPAGKYSIMECPSPSLPLVTSSASGGSNKKKRDAPYARFKCGSDGQWRGRADLSRCESEVGAEMKKIADEVAGGTQQPVDAAKSLEEKTASSKLNYGGDLMSTVVAIQKTANATATSDTIATPLETISINQIAKSLARSGSSILSDEQFPIWGDLPDLKQDVAATRLMAGIEQTMMTEAEVRRKADPPPAGQLDDTTSTLHVEDNIIAEVSIVDVAKLQGKQATEKVFPEQLKKQKQQQHYPQDVKIFIDDAESVVMPLSGLQKYAEDGMAKVVYIQYRNLDRFIGYSGELPTFNDSFHNQPVSGIKEDLDQDVFDFPVVGESRTHFLNSKVVTISMGDRRMKMQLDEPVVFTLRHEKIDDKYRPKCCYWDYDPWTYRGAWSAEGCYRVRTNATHTTCSCNHLTSFAILVDVTDQDAEASQFDRETLSMITNIGCLVSSFCLLLFWFTFQFVDRKLDNDQRTVHKHLAACLFFGELLFVAGIKHAVPFKILCNIVAGSLQFLFTSAFVWMLLEGIQIAIKLNELVPSTTRKWPIYYLAAYGTSTLLLGLTAGVSGLDAFGNNKVCWLHGVWLLYFVIPVAIVILINIVILSYLIYKACCLLRHTSDHLVCAAGKESKLYQTRSTIKGITAATILLGLTWSFGFLYVNQHFVFAAYLFCIFNSLQGFLIFLFFCVFNKWVRRQYAVWFRNVCCSRSDQSSSSANNNNKKSTSSSCCFPSSSRSSSRHQHRGVVYTPVTPSLHPNNNNSSSSGSNNNNNNSGADNNTCPTNLSTSSASQPSSSSNQNILAKMFKSRLSPTQTKYGANPHRHYPPSQTSEKSSLPDLTLGKYTNQPQSQDSKKGMDGQTQPAAFATLLLDPEQQPPSSGYSSRPGSASRITHDTSSVTVSSDANGAGDLQQQQQQQQAQVLVLAPSASGPLDPALLLKNSATFDSYFSDTNCNTENVTDYMQQAFLTSETAYDLQVGKELSEFDQKFAPATGIASLGTFDEDNELEEDEDEEEEVEEDDEEISETDEHARMLVTSPDGSELAPLPNRHSTTAIFTKSRTFSDFLSTLVKQHEDGLIDEETAQAQSRMFVSKIFEKHLRQVQLSTNQNSCDSGETPGSSTSSSLSISQIPDMHGHLDDLHICLSSSSLDKVGTKAAPTNNATRHDSGFCSNKANMLTQESSPTSNNATSATIDVDKTFPRRPIDRTLSESDLTHMGLNYRGDNHHNSDASKMFDDSDADQLLLVDTSAPSHVRSLTFLPGVNSSSY